MRCLCVCQSVRLCVCHVGEFYQTKKHVFKIFSPSDSQAIVGFLYQTSWQYSDGNPPNGGVECRWGRHKSRFWAYIWLHTLRPVSQVVTLIPGSKRRSLLMAGGDDEMFMTKSLNVTPKTTEQYLIARSDKSVAYVTNNKRFCSTFCTIEANYWQTWSIARPLWTAELLVYTSYTANRYHWFRNAKKDAARFGIILSWAWSSHQLTSSEI